MEDINNIAPTSNPNTETGAIDADVPRVMEGIDQHANTPLQADQYSETAADIDADDAGQGKGATMPVAPPGVPPSSGQDTNQNQQQNPAQPQNQSKPSQPKQGSPEALTGTPSQATQKASRIYNIAQTLSGGARYKYEVNPNTGKMEKTQIPVSGKHLALALALEAIGGGLTGLAQGKGAGNAGKGGAAAFAQGEARVQQQDQLQRQQASQAYARKAAIANTNMRMAMNQRALSESDQKLHDSYIQGYSSLLSAAESAGAVEDTVHGTDALHQLLQSGKLNVSQDHAIPVRYFPLMDANGKPVLGPNGEQKYDYDFALIKPNTELELPDDVKQTLQEHKIPGYVDRNGKPIDLPADMQTRLNLIIDGIEQARSIQNGQAVMMGLSKKLVNPTNENSGTTGSTSTKMPKMNSDIGNLVDSTAAKYPNVDPAIARALILEESGGNQNAVSKKGAIGLGQLMPATAQKYNADPKDAQQNVDASLHYLSDLITEKGSVPAALAAYHGIGSDGITTDSQYVKNILSAAGVKPKETPQGLSSDQIDELGKGLTAKQWNLMQQWKLFYDGTDTKPPSVDKLGEAFVNSKGKSGADPTDIGVVKNRLYSIYPADQYYNDTQTLAENRKLDFNSQKAQQVQSLKDQQQAQVESYLVPPKGFIPDPEKMLNMDDAQFRQWFTDNNVKMPPWAEFDRGVARGEIDPARASVRQYSGVGRMDAAEHEAWIKTFLDPTYNDARFKERTQFVESLNPGKQPGTVMYNAGTAVAHAQLASELFRNLNNRQSPVWNKAANAFGNDILGMSAPDAYNLVTHALANEVAKVTQGPGVTAEAEREDWQKRFGDYKSPEQASNNLHSAMGLMAPRLGQLIQDAQKHNATEYVQKHIQPQTLESFSKEGIAIPGISTRPLDTVKGAKSGRIVGFQDPETHEWVLGGPSNAGGWKF